MLFASKIFDLNRQEIIASPYDNYRYFQIDILASDFEIDFSVHFAKCISNLLGTFEMSVSELKLNADKCFFAKAPRGVQYDGLGCFMPFLRAHHDFHRVMSAGNQLIFHEIEHISNKVNFQSSDCYQLIEQIEKLVIPGIYSIEISSMVPNHAAFLKKIAFPLKLVPGNFWPNLIEHAEETELLPEVKLWLTKVRYLHTAFHEKNFIDQCDRFAHFLNESEFSLEEFCEDLDYQSSLSRGDKGLFARASLVKTKPGCLFSAPLPPFHRCLKMLAQHHCDGHVISSEDALFLESVYQVDARVWLYSPADFFGLKMRESHSDYQRAPVSIKEIKAKIKSKSYMLRTPQLPMDRALRLDEGINEVLRRIKSCKLASIQEKLNQVTEVDIDAFKAWLSNPQSMLTPDSFIHHPMFPYTALYLLRQGDLISTHQFGTMMSFWGSLPDIFNSNQVTGLPEFEALFTKTGEINPRAFALFSELIDVRHLRYLFVSNKTLVTDFFEKARSLPLSEQGFWIVDYKEPSHVTTIKTVIKNQTIRFLDFRTTDTRELFTTFGVQQAFVDAALQYPIKLNPVIGSSTVSDIKKGSLMRMRDIQVPFPGFDCPKTADYIPSPRVEDFIYHDKYHQLRASGVSPKETEMTVSMGKRMEKIQQHYEVAAIILEKIHKDNLQLLRDFFGNFREQNAWYQLPILLKYAHKAFEREAKLIAFCSKIALLFGKLKFRLYDMERGANGVSEVRSDNDLTQAILISLEADILFLQKRLKQKSQSFPSAFVKQVGRVAYHHFHLSHEDVDSFTSIANMSIFRMSHYSPIFRGALIEEDRLTQTR